MTARPKANVGWSVSEPRRNFLSRLRPREVEHGSSSCVGLHLCLPDVCSGRGARRGSKEFLRGLGSDFVPKALLRTLSFPGPLQFLRRAWQKGVPVPVGQGALEAGQCPLILLSSFTEVQMPRSLSYEPQGCRPRPMRKVGTHSLPDCEPRSHLFEDLALS